MDAEFDTFRAYLTLLARGQIPAALQSRLDASNMVQETLLSYLGKNQLSFQWVFCSIHVWFLCLSREKTQIESIRLFRV
jgi:hypothetical protein